MKILVLFIALILLTACQSNTRQRLDYQAFINNENLLQKDRIQQFRFQGWQPLDDRHLILKARKVKIIWLG